jgi:hypothetical protein
VGGNKYYVVIVDDFSRGVWALFLRRRSDLSAKFEEWMLDTARPCTETKIVISDNASEYKFGSFRSLLRKYGIAHQFSPPMSSPLNGVAERHIGVITEQARSMLIEAQCALNRWADAVHYSCIARNVLPKARLGGKSAFEILNVRIYMNNMLVFGCRVYLCLPLSQRKVWEVWRKGSARNFPWCGPIFIIRT